MASETTDALAQILGAHLPQHDPRRHVLACGCQGWESKFSFDNTAKHRAHNYHVAEQLAAYVRTKQAEALEARRWAEGFLLSDYNIERVDALQEQWYPGRSASQDKWTQEEIDEVMKRAHKRRAEIRKAFIDESGAAS